MGDIILNEEMKKKLLGVAPFSVNSTYDYVSKYHKSIKDLPEEYTPVFTISAFTKEEKEKVIKLVKDFQNAENKELRAVLRPKIKGFKKLYDAGTGEEIQFVMEAGVIAESVYDRITDNIVSDLLLQCIKISGLLDVDRLSLRF